MVIQEAHARVPAKQRVVVAVRAERLGGFREVVCGLTPAGACAEAGRCLRCDLERLQSQSERFATKAKELP